MFQRSYPHHFLWSISSCGLSSCCCVCCLLRLAAAAPPAAVVLLRSTACRRRRRLCRRHCCSLNACRQLPFSRQDPSGTYLLCVVCLRVLRGLVWWSYAVVFALCFEFQDGFLGVVWFWRRSRRARSYLHSRRILLVVVYKIPYSSCILNTAVALEPGTMVCAYHTAVYLVHRSCLCHTNFLSKRSVCPLRLFVLVPKGSVGWGFNLQRLKKRQAKCQLKIRKTELRKCVQLSRY